METFKGKDTIERLLADKVVVASNKLAYKLKGEMLVSKSEGDDDWGKSLVSLTWLLSSPCTDYKFVPVVGQWVEAKNDSGGLFRGKVTKIEGNEVYACWDERTYESWLYLSKWDYTVMPESEVKKHQVDMEFKKVGREASEYTVGDIVKYGVRLAEVKGKYRRASGVDLLQRLIIEFATDGTVMGMCRHDVGAEEVTPKCLKENVINLEEVK
ncbi:hypothetical protein MG295_00021 [Bacillus phage vB_BcgM]|nr:hypothetical protein MG295_00021 [Bacillus phage vB_BcgM]